MLEKIQSIIEENIGLWILLVIGAILMIFYFLIIFLFIISLGILINF
jgi:hypothetical protein